MRFNFNKTQYCLILLSILQSLLTMTALQAEGNKAEIKAKVEKAVLREWVLPERERWDWSRDRREFPFEVMKSNYALTRVIAFRGISGQRLKEGYRCDLNGKVTPVEIPEQLIITHEQRVSSDYFQHDLEAIDLAYRPKDDLWVALAVRKQVYAWDSAGRLVVDLDMSERLGLKSNEMIRQWLWVSDGTRAWVRIDLLGEIRGYLSYRWVMVDLSKPSEPTIIEKAHDFPMFKREDVEEDYVRESSISLAKYDAGQYLTDGQGVFYEAATGRLVSRPRVSVYVPWLHDQVGMTRVHEDKDFLFAEEIVTPRRWLKDHEQVYIKGAFHLDANMFIEELDRWQIWLTTDLMRWGLPGLMLLLFILRRISRGRWRRITLLLSMVCCAGFFVVVLLQMRWYGPSIQAYVGNTHDEGQRIVKMMDGVSTSNVPMAMEETVIDASNDRPVVFQVISNGWLPTTAHLVAGKRGVDASRSNSIKILYFEHYQLNEKKREFLAWLMFDPRIVVVSMDEAYQQLEAELEQLRANETVEADVRQQIE